MSSAIDLTAPWPVLREELLALGDDDFDEMMSDPPSRESVIDALVGNLARVVRPDKALKVYAVIQVKLWDRPGGGYDHREIIVDHGTCTVSEKPGDDPDVVLKLRPADLRDIVSGKANAMRLALKGRLRVQGDLRLARRITELFDL